MYMTRPIGVSIYIILPLRIEQGRNLTAQNNKAEFGVRTTGAEFGVRGKIRWPGQV
ncbi:hypothetical protein E2C01_083199 [Portunus trituberculatus]|uniref:Uncharacterized protein n=1 Tax=Portunus trituberculatus TaxID=210409 RepID=A0A5B7J5S7_PORTR|nr:hypothetical protein [Portunus trituberculatus]